MRPFASFQSITGVIIVFDLIHLVSCQILWQTYNDVIGAENYSYFHITQQGDHRLEVVSVTGDADVYVSDQARYPHYMDYELKSTTCGVDVVDIPSSFHRPVAVSVYGHPNFMNTTFVLNIYYLNNYDEQNYETFVSRYDPYEKSEYNENSETAHSERQYYTKHDNIQNDEDDSESPWMTLLIGILKIILDILF